MIYLHDSSLSTPPLFLMNFFYVKIDQESAPFSPRTSCYCVFFFFFFKCILFFLLVLFSPSSSDFGLPEHCGTERNRTDATLLDGQRDMEQHTAGPGASTPGLSCAEQSRAEPECARVVVRAWR